MVLSTTQRSVTKLQPLRTMRWELVPQVSSWVISYICSARVFQTVTNLYYLLAPTEDASVPSEVAHHRPNPANPPPNPTNAPNGTMGRLLTLVAIVVLALALFIVVFAVDMGAWGESPLAFSPSLPNVSLFGFDDELWYF